MNHKNEQRRIVPSLRKLQQLLRFIPNTLTLCNSLCGYAAILVMLQTYKHIDNQQIMAIIFAWSAGLILFAMIFDMFDGFTARLLHVSSLHGIQMDSLADMTTFGVAPATLVAFVEHNMCHIECPREFVFIGILCGIYLGCTALRLATYNVHAMYEKKSCDFFSGLPSPGAAAGICTLILFAATEKGGSILCKYFCYLPIYASVLGILMVSRVPYLHFGKYMASVKYYKKRMIYVISLFVIWVVSSVFVNPFLFPFFLVNTYILWGIVSYLVHKLKILKMR